MILAAIPCQAALYDLSQPTAVGVAAQAIRESINEALANRLRTDRLELIAGRLASALRKGASMEGVSLNVETFARTYEFLAGLPADIPVPEVVVESENGIGLDWQEGPRQVVSLTIDDTSFVGYSALFGHEPDYGRMLYTAGVIPRTFARLMTQLSSPA